jgi:ERCC4-type nuclease
MSVSSSLIDDREPAHIQALTFGGAPTLVTRLDAGDIWITTDDGCILACERKTSDDLLSTISQGRFLPQMTELVKVSRYAYLLITGTLTPGPENKTISERGITGWQWSSVQGALLSAAELGVMAVHLASDNDIEPAITWLAERRRSPEMMIPPLRIPRVLSTGEAILAALPGIGPERARALIAYCGNAATALQFLTDMTFDQGHVDGIGDGVKVGVRKALELPNWGELCVISTEHKLLDRAGRIELTPIIAN